MTVPPMQRRNVQRVAVVGAGISGVVSAAHLLRVGLDVVVFERSSEVGGIWIHSTETAIETQYPCLRPEDADTELQGTGRVAGKERRRLLHAPPGPCYDSLRNNIDTPLMQTTLNAWPEGTPRVVGHSAVKGYIQETALKTGTCAVTVFGALVTRIEKHDSKWCVRWASLDEHDTSTEPAAKDNSSMFDAIVVANGHYHVPLILDIPGLAEAKSRYPARIRHSKWFRNNTGYKDKNVLLIGGGVSSTDIAGDIGRCARHIYQSTRDGMSDMPASVLPSNATRVAQVSAISTEAEEGPDAAAPDGPPFTVHLMRGPAIPNIHEIIICTGYQFTLPFFPQYHDSHASPAGAGDATLTTDGGQLHNLHLDIFYIPDPTLNFVGVSVFTTTFPLFEFQAAAVAAFLSGAARLPPEADLRRVYRERVARKGLGRYLHSLKEEEEAYVDGLVAWVNEGRARCGMESLEGLTATWKAEKQLIREKIARLRAARAAERAAEVVNGAHVEEEPGVRNEQEAV